MSLASLHIGEKYFIPRVAQMNGHGWATIIASPAPGLYVVRYTDGATDTLKDAA